MNTENIKHIFQSQFDYHIYCNEIVRNIFGCSDINTRPELLDTTAEGDLIHYIGRMTDAEGRELGFFYTRVAEGSDVRRKRVGLRKLIAPYLKYDVDAAIAIFDDRQHWRLSYICDMKEGTTSAKRFSYVLGGEGQYKTPQERFERISNFGGNYKLHNIEEAFSVEALSKEFFDEYHRHYDRIVAELEWQGSTGALYHDYVKKMMGRIVFLHFLQKKGWLNGNPYFLFELFSKQSRNRKSDFLEQVLEPLFFGIFNTESEKRKNLFTQRGWDVSLLNEWIELPYLNGGLFEEDDVDKLNVKLPASLFEDLFGFLASYNFTVDENDPDDAEIGVDPEMLGKIFESLLEDNKAKGAFYTPKEIVRYMCKESLIAYLSSKLDGKLTDAVRQFVEHHELPEELQPCREAIIIALREVKICDPAIGSGAFPMGLLNELWRCREAIEGDSMERVELKKEIIENNVYGVDIEKGAIDIARLRFWLSIVVDAEKPEPLPNFDYKFMQGNSLIESFEGHDLSSMLSETQQRRGGKVSAIQYGMNFGDKETRQNLQLLLKQYFSITDHKKKEEYRSLIDDTVKAYILQQGLPYATEQRLQTICTYANQDFFLWHTWFKNIFDKGGFDIVIGNPPYVARISDELKVKYGKLYPEAKKKIFDLFNFFMVLSVQLASNTGVTTMIVPPTWLNNKNNSKLRSFLASNGLFQVNYMNENVFDSAIVYSCIYFTSLGSNKTTISCIDTNLSNSMMTFFETNKIDISIIRDTGDYIPMKPSEGIVDSIKKKIAFDLLGNISKIVFGIQERKSAADPSYTFTSNPQNIYKKILNGKHINSYSIIESGQFLHYGNWLWNPRKPEVFEAAEKILIRQVGHYPICAYDTEKYYTMNTIYNCIISDERYETKYVLAILNSKLMHTIWKEIYPEKKDVFPRLKKEQLIEIPIATVDKNAQSSIITIVDRVLSAKKTNPLADTTAEEREIDRLVYNLYNLTEEEIAVIEGQ